MHGPNLLQTSIPSMLQTMLTIPMPSVKIQQQLLDEIKFPSQSHVANVPKPLHPIDPSGPFGQTL